MQSNSPDPRIEERGKLWCSVISTLSALRMIRLPSVERLDARSEHSLLITLHSKNTLHTFISRREKVWSVQCWLQSALGELRGEWWNPLCGDLLVSATTAVKQDNSPTGSFSDWCLGTIHPTCTSHINHTRHTQPLGNSTQSEQDALVHTILFWGSMCQRHLNLCACFTWHAPMAMLFSSI